VRNGFGENRLWENYGGMRSGNYRRGALRGAGPQGFSGGAPGLERRGGRRRLQTTDRGDRGERVLRGVRGGLGGEESSMGYEPSVQDWSRKPRLDVWHSYRHQHTVS
jgi:hypothetical protein